MGSRKRGRKQKQQQRLVFEPIAETTTTAGLNGSALGEGLSLARVKFLSSSGKVDSPSGSRLARAFDMAKTKRSSKQQQTLEASLGKGKTRGPKKQPASEADRSSQPLTVGTDVKVRRRVAASPPPSSFMPRSKKGARRKIAAESDSESSVEEDGGIGDSDGEGPLKQETPRRTASRSRKVVTVSNDSDSDEAEKSSGDETEEPHGEIASSQPLPDQVVAESDSDDQPLVTPRSSMPRRRAHQPTNLDDSEDEEEDVIQSPAKRRRLAYRKAAPVSPDDSVSSQDKPTNKAISDKGPSPPSASTARSLRSRASRKHRTEKEKRMELLRRRRAGEKSLTMEDLESSPDEEDEQGGLYDTDSELEVLEVFDDESEAEQEAPTAKKGKKKAKKSGAKKALPEPLDEDADTEDENFIDDEDDTIGVPDEALAQIPLEFTRASRKPLKAHFKDAIEWLVHRKINPAFDRGNEVYVTAWRRLSDEVTGLANSKFVSSVWRPDFYKALRARPYVVQEELGAGLTTEFEHCQACGRSGHPATWRITFQGKPYNSKTLDEIESDSEDTDEDSDRDAEGNIIPSEDKAFFVGQTCNSNAGTAHNLIHWKLALRDWVDDRLEQDGWLTPEKIVGREKMKLKKRHKLADEIVELWDQCDFLKGLFLDFKQNIETARNMDPTKVARGTRRY